MVAPLVRVDWDNDLDFSDADEDISPYVMNVELQRAISDALEAGSCTLTLRNDDQRFTPGARHQWELLDGAWESIGEHYEDIDYVSPYGEGLTIGRRVEILAPADGSDAPNLIGGNGGFETLGAGGDDVFAEWSELKRNGTISAETTIVYAGARSCKFTKIGLLSPLIFRDIAVTPGRVYRLKFAHWGEAHYEVYDPTQTTREALAGSVDSPGAWATQDLEFRAPLCSTTLTVRFGYGAPATWYLDAVEIYEQPALMSGFIERIVPEIVAEGEHELVTTMTVKDVLFQYSLRKKTTLLLQDYATGALVDVLLDSLGWEGLWRVGYSRLRYDSIVGGPGADRRVLDTGQSTVPYILYDDQNVLAALKELVQAEHGALWVGADGRVHFEDRHHRIKDRTPVTVFTDSLISELVIEQDAGDVFNHVEVVAYPREVRAQGVVWTANAETSAIALAVGESKDFYPSWRAPGEEQRCEVDSIVSPLSGTDYAANSHESGLGQSRTNWLQVTEESEDDRYFLRVTNIHPTETIYVTKLQVRATPLVALDPVTKRAVHGKSISQYLEREMPRLNNRLLASELDAQGLANYLLLLHQAPQRRVKKLTVQAPTLAALYWQKTLEISDRITVRSAKYHVSGDYFIDRISHQVAADMEDLRTEYDLSEAPFDFWILGTSRLGLDAMVGY